MKDIKNYYYNFLSSLKFENLNEQKSSTDYKSSEMQLSEDIPKPDHMTMQAIKESQFNFEDEMAIENKGLASYMLLVSKIK